MLFTKQCKFCLSKILDSGSCNAVALQEYDLLRTVMKMRNEEDWLMFLDLCLKTNKIECLQELLNLFLTIEEKEHLASRMQIIRVLLDKKLSQREMSDKMNVSISQITRGSNALKIINDDLLKFIENYIR